MTRPSSKRHDRTVPAIFAVPALLAVASLIGLIAALLTDGPLDLLWSAIVAVPLFEVVRRLIKR
jgi:hypothetical protein